MNGHTYMRRAHAPCAHGHNKTNMRARASQQRELDMTSHMWRACGIWRANDTVYINNARVPPENLRIARMWLRSGIQQVSALKVSARMFRKSTAAWWSESMIIKRKRGLLSLYSEYPDTELGENGVGARKGGGVVTPLVLLLTFAWEKWKVRGGSPPPPLPTPFSPRTFKNP